MEKDQLVHAAQDMLSKAYVPYSRFPVGAALLSKNGEVYQGCNIENASYPVTCCAERVALFKAVSQGVRDFAALAVIANTDRPVPPCGACRQAMSEFFEPSMPVYITNKDLEVKEITVEELLPFSFTPEDLESGQG